MLEFGKLEIVKEDPSKLLLIDTKEYQGKPNIIKLDLFKKVTPKKSKSELRLIEPGNKIPIGQFHSVSQWCEGCGNVSPFAHKPEKKRMICLTCKTIKTY